MSATAKNDLSENAYARVFAGWNTPRGEFNNAVVNATLSGQTALNSSNADTVRRHTLSADSSPQKNNVEIDYCGQSKVMISDTPPNPGRNCSTENAMNIASVRKAMESNSKAVKASLSKSKTVVASVNDINTIV